MRVLITGITGFVGSHLTETLLAAGHDVHGVSLSGSWDRSCAQLERQVPLHTTNIHDRETVESLLLSIQPEWVFHLAGYANTGKSYREQDLCWHDNLGGTRSLYETIARTDLRPRILFASTGLIYGDPEHEDQSLDESAVMKPASPYAASKAAADLYGYQVSRHPGLDVVRVRLFNQIGPRQSADYSVANFARQIAAAEAGKIPPVIETGDLSAHRDLTDVRDVTIAFRLLMEKGQKGEAYNAGRGRTWRIHDILQLLLAQARIPLEVREKVEPNRKADTFITRANSDKLRRATGWVPKYEMEQTLKDVLDYWRQFGT